MPFFKLKSGTHQEMGNGHIYTKGEIVESEYNLVKMHGKHKFQLTDEKPRHATDEDADDLDEDLYKPAVAKADRGPTAPPESPKEDERRKERGDDLDFTTERKKTSSSKKGTKAQQAKAAKAEEKEPNEDLGDDVTSDFEEDAGEDYRVYKKGRKYFITDKEDEVMHEEEITSKDMVVETLKTWNEEYEG